MRFVLSVAFLHKDFVMRNRRRVSCREVVCSYLNITKVMVMADPRIEDRLKDGKIDEMLQW